MWVESALSAVRRDFPAPVVHARNLWHLSAVMWDSWAAYQPGVDRYFDDAVVPEDRSVDGAAEAINYAAHQLLTSRYTFAIGGAESLAQFDVLLDSMCLPHPDEFEAEPGSPAAVGQAIAEAAIELGDSDGAREINRYINLDYQPVNEPLAVSGDSIAMDDPNRWQPLELANRVTRNGQALGAGVQIFVGSQWGSVTSFALPPADEAGITLDPGPPPLLGTDSAAEFIAAAIEVVDYADTLGGERGAEVIDISPGSIGNNTVGTSDGQGHDVNPVTGQPYEPNLIPLGDYGRVIAEFWADGPDSETPPGHWNTLAIAASDQLDAYEWQGTEQLDRFEWDLRLFFVLNAALHDAAVATWGAKAAYDYARPISMIRYLGSRGELVETPGLVETVTADSAAPGGRHQGLTVGATAVRSWLGPPEDEDTEVAGVGWLEAIDWLPYQRPTFVSPAFAGYVSGHSAFSRAAAEVLTLATGSAYFPGGLFTHAVAAGELIHEEGPTVDVELQWATYFDAADEAGESRKYGGIHVAADDFEGRLLGQQVAELVWDEAQEYFEN
jgi:hypothetical protein